MVFFFQNACIKMFHSVYFSLSCCRLVCGELCLHHEEPVLPCAQGSSRGWEVPGSLSSSGPRLCWHSEEEERWCRLLRRKEGQRSLLNFFFISSMCFILRNQCWVSLDHWALIINSRMLPLPAGSQRAVWSWHLHHVINSSAGRYCNRKLNDAPISLCLTCALLWLMI